MPTKKLVSVFVLALFAGPLHAEIPTVDARRVSGGQVADFRNHRYEPAENPKPLTLVQDPNSRERYMMTRAQQVLSNRSNLSVLLIDQGRIIFEGYNLPATGQTTQFSFSMSKSVVGYLIGEAFCEGRIKNLDDPAKKYADLLGLTVLGDATVKNLLTMSSGIRRSVHAGAQYREEWEDLRGGVTTSRDRLLAQQSREIPPGREFRYSATDTMALAEIIDRNGGFSESYRKFWAKVRSESTSHWLVDKNDRAIAGAGLSMITRDWARTAMYVMDKIRNDRGCLGDFYRDATQSHLPTGASPTGRAFSGYGFQTWVNPKSGGHSFWWVGYGGQRVAVDPAKQRIMVISSWREDYIQDVLDLFREFQKM